MGILFVLILAFMSLYGIWAMYFMQIEIDETEHKYWALWDKRHQALKKSLRERKWDEKVKRFRDTDGKFLKTERK